MIPNMYDYSLLLCRFNEYIFSQVWFFFSFFLIWVRNTVKKKYSTIYCTKCNIKVLQVFLAEKEECRYFLEWTNGLLLYLDIALLGKKKWIYSRAIEKRKTIMERTMAKTDFPTMANPATVVPMHVINITWRINLRVNFFLNINCS